MITSKNPKIQSGIVPGFIVKCACHNDVQIVVPKRSFFVHQNRIQAIYILANILPRLWIVFYKYL